MVGLKTKKKKGLKSVHFKKTVMQSSFLSKVLSFSILKEMRIEQLSS